MSIRVGTGWDAHTFVAGRPLVLGGIELDYPLGLSGHSDADALTHAIMDALLGAAGLADIGELFPDDDPAYEGARSLDLLRRVVILLHDKGWHVVNVDAVVVCEAPRIASYRDAMKAALGDALAVAADRVGLKGSTSEGMGALGRGEGLAASAVALLRSDVSQ